MALIILFKKKRISFSNVNILLNEIPRKKIIYRGYVTIKNRVINAALLAETINAVNKVKELFRYKLNINFFIINYYRSGLN